MADVKILMLGGRRAGKSSILASMVKQLRENVEIIQHVRINQKRTSRPVPVSLSEKQNNLESFLSKPQGNFYLVDFGADDSFSYYPFSIKIPNKRGGFYLGNIGVEFIDCPGESYDECGRQDLYEEIRREMPDTDIFIIAVDTPYLMDVNSDSGKFKNVNRVNEIIELFDELIQFNRDDDYKKVIFAPVKCEAWRDDIDTVVKKLQHYDYYGPLFDRIKKENRWSCCIIPILTAGGISFTEFGERMMLDGVECSPLGTRRVRMKDGSEHELLPDDRLVTNARFYQPFYSWFENIGQYRPENCDQIALHVLRFIVFKALVETSHNILPPWMHGFPSHRHMKEMIFNLEQSNFLMDGNPNSIGMDKGIVHVRKIETGAEINKY